VKKVSLRVAAIWGLLLLIAVLLLAWALHTVPLVDLGQVLAELQAWQLLLILFFNTGIIFLFTLRWWLIMRAQGTNLPFLATVRYYLAAFSVSYFTPGQHFGGEPIQVLFLRKGHGVPGSRALAAIALDRAITVFCNFAVLATGIAFILGSGILTGVPLADALPVSLLLGLLPVAYLFLVWLGRRPLGNLISKLQGRLAQGLRSAEEQLGQLVRQKPGLFLQGLLVSVGIWAALFYEFWLMMHFLGIDLDGLGLVVIVTAGRLALWVPTPGAVGALEASQVLAVQALGFDPAYGLSLGLLIRARDIFFGILGLVLGGLEGLNTYRRLPG